MSGNFNWRRQWPKAIANHHFVMFFWRGQTDARYVHFGHNLIFSEIIGRFWNFTARPSTGFILLWQTTWSVIDGNCVFLSICRQKIYHLFQRPKQVFSVILIALTSQFLCVYVCNTFILHFMPVPVQYKAERELWIECRIAVSVCGKARKDKFLKISLKIPNTHIAKVIFPNGACAFFPVSATDPFNTLWIVNIVLFWLSQVSGDCIWDTLSLHHLEGKRRRVSYPVSLFTMVKRINPNDSRGIRAVGAEVPISPPRTKGFFHLSQTLLLPACPRPQPWEGEATLFCIGSCSPTTKECVSSLQQLSASLGTVCGQGHHVPLIGQSFCMC